MAKLMAPNIRIDWYPEGHFLVDKHPLPDELNSGYNLSPAIVTGFTLDFTDTATVDTTTIYDSHAAEMFAHRSAEGNLQFFLAPRGSNAANEAAYRMAEQLFYTVGPKSGYLVKRFGYKWDTSYTMEQKIDVFKVQSTTPRVVSEEGSPILLDVVFLPDGDSYSATDGLLPLPKTNLVRNGDFEQGLTHWRDFDNSDEFVTVSTTSTWNDRMWGGLGGNMLYVAETATEWTYSEFNQYVYGDFLAGRYVALSGYFATPGDGSEFRVRLHYRGGGYSRTARMSAPFYSGTFLHRAFQIPRDTDRIDLEISIYGPSNYESTRFWADKIMLAMGNTEKEALANSAVYKPHKDEL